MRILGIDYGTKRLGLAISDEQETLALPYQVIEDASLDQQIIRLKEITDSEHIGKIVIGLPYKSGGQLGQRAQTVLEFARQLTAHLLLPVETYDERLTTVESAELLRDAHLTRKKKRRHINAVAAQIILQRYLDAASGT